MDRKSNYLRKTFSIRIKVLVILIVTETKSSSQDFTTIEFTSIVITKNNNIGIILCMKSSFQLAPGSRICPCCNYYFSLVSGGSHISFLKVQLSKGGMGDYKTSKILHCM